MNKLILAYNFTGERLQALRLICMMLKVACRPVARGEMLQPMGYLAGVKGVEPVTEVYDGDEGTEEMLYLCGFDRDTNISIRSRAVYLPRACCFSMAFSPPPRRACSRLAISSLIFSTCLLIIDYYVLFLYSL